jgi:hypothetical protein
MAQIQVVKIHGFPNICAYRQDPNCFRGSLFLSEESCFLHQELIQDLFQTSYIFSKNDLSLSFSGMMRKNLCGKPYCKVVNAKKKEGID